MSKRGWRDQELDEEMEMWLIQWRWRNFRNKYWNFSNVKNRTLLDVLENNDKFRKRWGRVRDEKV